METHKKDNQLFIRKYSPASHRVMTLKKDKALDRYLDVAAVDSTVNWINISDHQIHFYDITEELIVAKRRVYSSMIIMVVVSVIS